MQSARRTPPRRAPWDGDLYSASRMHYVAGEIRGGLENPQVPFLLGLAQRSVRVIWQGNDDLLRAVFKALPDCGFPYCQPLMNWILELALDATCCSRGMLHTVVDLAFPSNPIPGSGWSMGEQFDIKMKSISIYSRPVPGSACKCQLVSIEFCTDIQWSWVRCVHT